MNISKIDILESIKLEKIFLRENFFIKLTNYILPLSHVFFFLYITGYNFYSDLIKNEPIGLSVSLLLLVSIIGIATVFALTKINTLTCVKGISEYENSQIVKEIALKNDWKIHSSNPQMMVIKFSSLDSGTDWGKQMTILYDGNDILVNCISFALGSTPSPFHLFANRKKISKLNAEFELKIKNAQQQHL